MADESAQRITEVTEGDSAIINMPSAGSHKSRVIEFSTSITGRRLARPQEIGRNGTYLERELDDSIPLSKGTVLSLLFASALRRNRQNGNRFHDVRSWGLFLIRLPDRVAVQRDDHLSPSLFLLPFLDSLSASDEFL